MTSSPVSRSEQVHDPLPIYFSPPLYDQRRLWVMSILRQERVSTILDVGCGDGNLLACLCNPPPWLSEEHRPTVDILDPSAEYQSEALSFVNARRLVGLDISREELEKAVECTAPEEPTEILTSWSGRRIRRWDSLEVTILEGNFADYNPELCDVECIVATEVIEHLPGDVLPEFAPMLLGAYAPRLLLLTTPSYDYNARFHDPTTPENLRSGYPDPTGQTGRVFRHPDHKFEWTRAEFAKWCTDAAHQWGYDLVECSTRGVCSLKDEWGRDSGLGGASQVALFRRQDIPDASAVIRRQRARAERLLPVRKHALVGRHSYEADPRSRSPLGSEEIQQHMCKAFHDECTRIMSVYQLWLSNEVSRVCGGWLSLMLRAIDTSEDLRLIEEQDKPKDEWDVEYLRTLTPPAPNASLEVENVKWNGDDLASDTESMTSSVDHGLSPEREGWGWEPDSAEASEKANSAHWGHLSDSRTYGDTRDWDETHSRGGWGEPESAESEVRLF